VLFLDSRGSAHAGRGPGSSFESAVSAAASVGVYLARERMECQLVTDAGPAAIPGRFEDVLLDTLAVIQPSRATTLTSGLAQLGGRHGGMLIAVMGRLSPADARQLAAARRGDGPALALLLAVTSWSSPPRNGPAPDEIAAVRAATEAAAAAAAETAGAATILTAAGWRVTTVTAGQPLITAWQQLSRPAGPLTSPPGARPAADGPPVASGPAGVSR
jgi:uncharacterized protein (DUF58 family)